MTSASRDLPVRIVASMRSEPANVANYLIWPALVLLLGAFIVPLAIFLWQSFSEFGSAGELVEEARFVVTSTAVLRAISFTMVISLLVTISSLLLAYPFAYALTKSSGLLFNLLIATVVVPYFTSAIVRTYAWMVLLGRTGVINQALLGIGLTDEPIQFLYNQTAIVVGMTYVLLPYMALTLYASMRAVDGRLLQAAEGLGASPVYIFRRIFLPLTFPGIIAGALIVFILSIGFFITPALMGGPRDTMIAMLIEREVEINLNWSLAAIISLLVLLVTLILYALYYRVSNIRQMLE